jgi:hypothetical protein
MEENKKNEALRRKSGRDANEAKESLQLFVSIPLHFGLFLNDS